MTLLMDGVPPRPNRDDAGHPKQRQQQASVLGLSKADRQAQDRQRADEVLALCLKHEGEQRLWAYPMH